MIEDAELIRRAANVAQLRKLSSTVRVGIVGSALVTDKGSVYVGVSIDAACGVGFCAEHNAIGSMVTNGESMIASIVAVNGHGQVVSPCGRCREIMIQVDERNLETRVLLRNNRTMTLKELLPEYWLSRTE